MSFALLAAAVGAILHLGFGWRLWALLAAFGTYAAADRLGWIPGPYDQKARNRLRGGVEAPAARQPDRRV
jgi:hypothetical protein